ncbi:MAG: amino-acid N-acetyltransferase [Gammaproteobacteria bacterium]|nr:amino-acid N-acetyltransferase [Gammaproteobacteria bacterium]MDX5374215.1 amino-acid N-acetyltransferase [Gammaproteobacteria bacterium]
MWFRNAAPYIHAHRGRTFVLYFGGEALEGEGFASLIHDIALLHSLGIHLVLVHGARPQIERRLRLEGIEPRYAEGLRVTDEKALGAVKEAAGCVRVEIEARLSTSLVNTPMSGIRLRVASGNFVTARPIGVRNGVDFCHTGKVRRIDAEAIRAQLALDNLVLLSPLGYSPTGEAFNLSAEEVATETAIALKADKLIYLGIAREKRPLPGQLGLSDAEQLLKRRKQLHPETRLHLENAINAAQQGVRRVHLVQQQRDGALLLELFTRDGDGTLVTADIYEGVRDARIDDVAGILELIRPLEEAGTLVRRSREQLELEIQRFVVVERDGMIIGCAALYPFEAEGVGELACLAIHPDYRRGGRGDVLLAYLEARARKIGLERLFVLTTETLHWFRERGFNPGSLDDLPVKRRELYNYQRNSKILYKRAGG